MKFNDFITFLVRVAPFVLLLTGIFLIWAGLFLGPYTTDDKETVNKKLRATYYLLFRVLISLVILGFIIGSLALFVWIWIK